MSNVLSASSGNKPHWLYTSAASRAFSEAPTVITFFAVAGGTRSTSPKPPLPVPNAWTLPPANTVIISWFKGDGGASDCW